MDAKTADAVYTVLVNVAGAVEDDRAGFVRAHIAARPCDEWRFMGALGFGGKYRSRTNTVDCYPEDMNDDRAGVIAQTNRVLREQVERGERWE